MGEVVRFVSRSEIERARLIREARAIYDSIFPPTDAAKSQFDNETPHPRVALPSDEPAFESQQAVHLVEDFVAVVPRIWLKVLGQIAGKGHAAH
jgi:hypothetical protein